MDNFAHVRRHRQYALALFLLLIALVSQGACGLPEGLDKQELVFIYVHGFGEVKKTPAFEAKMNAFFKPLGLKASAVSFRWTEDKLFENHRAACTHIHKGGLLQRDYSNLAPAIGALTLLREGIAVAGAPAKLNCEWRVGSGRVHWNDIARFEGGAEPVLIQQNLNTKHYRAVALGEDGKRTRKAWGASLSGVLRKVGLVP
jgi:hypothetical protein